VYSALGRSNPTLLAGVLAIGVNAVGNWALIFGHLGLPALGVLGSGLATFASQCFMLAVLIGYGALDRRVAHFALFARPFRFDAAGQRALWRLGAPIGVAITLEILIFSTTVVLMGLISDADLEAHAIVFQIASVAFMIPLGLSQAATVRVGHAYGALDRRGVMRAGRVSLAITLAMMTGTAAAMLIAPRTFIAVFIDVSARANSEVLARAESFLRVAALFQIADGAQAVVSGMLRGVQDTRAPMWIAIAGYWGVGIPLGSALGFGTSLRGLGLWIGLAVGLACVAALLVLRWAARERAGFPPTILIDAEPQSYGAV
jgi:MATE family multidrug resistance protein